MPIPTHDPVTGYLPPGVHRATLEECQARFCWSRRREKLWGSLLFGVEGLLSLNVQRIWIAGSYVTAKARPGDIDLVFVKPSGWSDSSAGLFSSLNRKKLKADREIDLWPMPSYQPSVSGPISILEFFASDSSGTPKGMILVTVEGSV